MPIVHIATRIEAHADDLGLPFLTVLGFDSSRRKRVGLGEHAHEGHEITFLFEGEVTWVTDRGESLRLRGGDLAITQPSVVHRGLLNLIQPSTFFWTVVDLRRAGGNLFSGAEREELRAQLDRAGNAVRNADKEFARELARLHDDLAAQQAAPATLTRTAIRARIGTVLVRAAASLTAPGERARGDYTEEAQRYIDGRLGDADLSVDAVAQRVGISVSRLHAVFKERTGLAPNDFIQRRRVERACELLRNTATPVTRIALNLGFASSQYFATCFRKYTGMTPGQMRKGEGTGMVE
jgi:AraC-like DNA-binding protein